MLHRYGSVAEALAQRLLAMRPGDRLESIGQLAASFGTGRGTVQTALHLLLAEGAVTLESRGSQGSYVTSLNQERLLARSGLFPIIGVMAVPYSNRFRGLATGLTRAFEQAGLPLVLAHLSGGKNRLHFLRTGRCDFAVISRLAWQEEAGVGDLRLLFRFGPGSHVGDHVLLLGPAARAGIADGHRVGVDPSSYDHLRLTMEECRGKAVQLVQMDYARAVPKLLSGEIDATVWDAGLPLPPDSPLTVAPRRQSGQDQEDTEAVLVVSSAPASLADLLAARIDPTMVRTVQDRVVTGQEAGPF